MQEVLRFMKKDTDPLACACPFGKINTPFSGIAVFGIVCAAQGALQSPETDPAPAAPAPPFPIEGIQVKWRADSANRK